jgi:hypothetical protein
MISNRSNKNKITFLFDLLLRRNHNLLLDNRLLRCWHRLYIVAVLLVLLLLCLLRMRRLGHHGCDCGWLLRSMRSGSLEHRVIVHLLLLVLVLLRRRRTKALEGKVTHLLRQLVNRNLLCAPRQAKLGSRKPHATALDNRRHLNALHQQVLHWNTLVRSAIQVIELRVEVTIALRQLHLDVRRVAQHIALLVTAVLKARCVERLNHVLAQIRLEPRLGILHALLNHQLIHLLQHTLELLKLRAIVLATERQVHRILCAILALKRVQAKRKRHGHRRLHHQTLAVVIQVRLLRATLKRLGRRKSDGLGRERGRESNTGHVWMGMVFF